MYWLIALILTALYYVIIYKWDKKRQAAYKMAQQVIPNNLPDSEQTETVNTKHPNKESVPIPRTVFGEMATTAPTERSEIEVNNAIKKRPQEITTSTAFNTKKTLQTNTVHDEAMVSETVELLGASLIAQQNKKHNNTSFPK